MSEDPEVRAALDLLVDRGVLRDVWRYGTTGNWTPARDLAWAEQFHLARYDAIQHAYSTTWEDHHD